MGVGFRLGRGVLRGPEALLPKAGHGAIQGRKIGVGEL